MSSKGGRYLLEEAVQKASASVRAFGIPADNRSLQLSLKLNSRTRDLGRRGAAEFKKIQNLRSPAAKLDTTANRSVNRRCRSNTPNNFLRSLDALEAAQYFVFATKNLRTLCDL